MNVLITNTQEEQAHLILRCLVHEVDRIVVTISGDNFFQRSASISRWSRHVSRRYRVPDCSADWRTGAIQRENTPAEEHYIQRIEEISTAESIDVIFPSYDAEVYVFSKNKERLAARGIATVVSDYESLVPILDKSLTLRAAEDVGFPIPKTHVVADHGAIKDVVDRIGPPWVIKPRCSAHSVGVTLASDREELEAAFRKLSLDQERPIVQEYIPHVTRRNFYLVVNRESEIVSMVSPEVLRTRRGRVNNSSAAVVSTNRIPFTDQVRVLVRELGVWGCMTLQTLVDSRDGKLKLLEINPRLGTSLWFRTELGVNEPLMALRLARGEDPGGPPVVPEGIILLDPLLDSLHFIGKALERSFAWIRARLPGGQSDSDLFEKEYIEQLLRAYKSEYFTRRKRVTSPFNRDLLSDPCPPIVRAITAVAKGLRNRWR